MIIVSAKRAEVGQDPLAQASTSGQSSTSSPDPESPSTSDSINSNRLPSSASGDLGRPPYTSGGTELPWYSSDGTLVTPGSGRVLPGTKSKLTSQPGTSMRTQTYSFAPGHWSPSTKIGTAGEIAPASSSKSLPSSEDVTPLSSTNSDQLPPSASGELRRPPSASGGTELPWYPSDDKELHWLTPGGVQLVQPGTTSKLPPATSVRTKTYPFVATTEIETASESPSSGEITPTSPAQKPQSKSFFSSLANKSKVFLSNLASKSKSLLNSLASKSKSFFGELNHPNLQIY